LEEVSYYLSLVLKIMKLNGAWGEQILDRLAMSFRLWQARIFKHELCLAVNS